MTRCEVCGNEYDKTLEVVVNGVSHYFDCFECAIHALAPECEHCGCKIIGHGVEVKSKKAPDLIIENDPAMVAFVDKVCYLNLGSVKYTVILNTAVAGLDKKNEEEPPLLETKLAPREATCSQFLPPTVFAEDRLCTKWAGRRLVR